MICALAPFPTCSHRTLGPSRWCPRNDADSPGNYFTKRRPPVFLYGDDGVCNLDRFGDDVGAVELNQHLDDADGKNAAVRIALLQCTVGSIQQVAKAPSIV